MRVLGIETSCDETAAAVYDGQAGLLSHRLHSQVQMHELASRVQLARQAMLLTLPGEMGERFKVIGLTRNFEQPLRGFAVRDLAATL